MRTVGYLWDTLFGWVDSGSGGFSPADPLAGLQPIAHHVAHADTKRRFHETVQVSDLKEHLTFMQATAATDEDLLRVHTPEYVQFIKEQSALAKGGDAGDGATPLGKNGFHIAALAAGGAMRATEAVLSGEVDCAYALINPPGHHAESDQGMGFCVFNNVSVAIAYAREKLGVQRVAVVDWDVHHGNGTESIWWDEPEVLTISIHQHLCYPPESGYRTTHPGALNIPLPPGSGNKVYQLAMDTVVLPAVRAFKPELIVVASGFDAAVMDPLARQMLTQRGFKGLTQSLMSVADEVCGGKVVFCQEGGYCPHYVPICGLGVLEVLTGQPSGFGDPFAEMLDPQGVDDLYEHQRLEVSRAAELLAPENP